MSEEPFLVEICNQRGLHARASAKVVRCAEQYDATIYVSCNGRSAEALSIMDLMMLGAHKGATVTLEGKGPEHQQALEAIRNLIVDKFGEEK